MWLKIAWTAWLFLWAPFYFKQYGAQNFLFFCDLGNVLIAAALWLESQMIFSWQAVGLLCEALLRWAGEGVSFTVVRPSLKRKPNSKSRSDRVVRIL